MYLNNESATITTRYLLTFYVYSNNMILWFYVLLSVNCDSSLLIHKNYCFLWVMYYIFLSTHRKQPFHIISHSRMCVFIHNTNSPRKTSSLLCQELLRNKVVNRMNLQTWSLSEILNSSLSHLVTAVARLNFSAIEPVCEIIPTLSKQNYATRKSWWKLTNECDLDDCRSDRAGVWQNMRSQLVSRKLQRRGKIQLLEWVVRTVN